MHKSILFIAGVLLLSTIGADAGSNPLIGNWKLMKGDPGGCHSPISFTGTTQTLNMAGQAPTTTQVTYNVSPQKVYVIGNTGLSGAVGYIVIDHDHIKLDSWADCAWARQ